MNLTAITISHKTAPVAIRELFAYTKKKQTQIICDIVKDDIAKECVLLSTCNRTEFYMHEARIGAFFQYLSSVTENAAYYHSLGYIKILQNEYAAEHIFNTAAGLESMVLGEDQILGQMKQAHALAMENLTSGVYLNTLIRYAVTAAKKAKTQTELSKIPVSVASLAAKECCEYLGTLCGKRIMLIGAGGSVGSALLKDLIAVGNVDIYATSRRSGGIYEGATVISYADRYKFMNDMDAVISATSSPHLTIEESPAEKALTTPKKRIFIDLAVPKDIQIKKNDHTKYIGIDDFEKIAEHNNYLKAVEAEKAREILKDYMEKFYVWQTYFENAALIDEIIRNLSAKFGDERAGEILNYVLRRVKRHTSKQEIECLIKCLEKSFH
ncbi:MAG: glutamyl-tRNA reductase [Clostridia bacterium]|nr:glutamyl-tRNA reductase [Clostridia bacterium]